MLKNSSNNVVKYAQTLSLIMKEILKKHTYPVLCDPPLLNLTQY